MQEVRITSAQDSPHDVRCTGLHIDDYAISETVLPPTARDAGRKVFRVVIRGRNLVAAAQPLLVTVGEAPIRFVRISPDERSVEGILYEEPPEGASVEVRLGGQDHVRHARAVERTLIRRL